MNRFSSLALALFLGLAFILGVGVPALVVYLVSRAREPATCQEFVELLREKGMEVSWKKARYAPQPSVFVANGRGHPDLVILEEYASVGIWKNAVVVIQYPTSREAREKGGATPHSFVWGRFLGQGDPGLV
jgi:hypothetical protein